MPSSSYRDLGAAKILILGAGLPNPLTIWTLITLRASAFPTSMVGLQGSSLTLMLIFLADKEVSAMSSSSEASDALLEAEREAWVRTEVVMLRIRGRMMAMLPAMIPVPGSAVAHMVALMELAVGVSHKVRDSLRNRMHTAKTMAVKQQPFQIYHAQYARYASHCTKRHHNADGDL
jgi:hypothetical protein